MLQNTRGLVASLFGTVSDADGWSGPAACMALPAVPALALVEVIAAGAERVRQGWTWLRKATAAVLRSAAEHLDPSPVGMPVEVAYAEAPTLDTYPAAYLDGFNDGHDMGYEAAINATAPPVLVMSSAAQVTTEAEPAIATPTLVSAEPEAAPAPEATDTNWAGGEGYHGNYFSPKAPDYAALVTHHGSIRKAAKALGIAESTLRCRLKRVAK